MSAVERRVSRLTEFQIKSQIERLESAAELYAKKGGDEANARRRLCRADEYRVELKQIQAMPQAARIERQRACTSGGGKHGSAKSR